MVAVITRQFQAGGAASTVRQWQRLMTLRAYCHIDVGSKEVTSKNTIILACAGRFTLAKSFVEVSWRKALPRFDAIPMKAEGLEPSTYGLKDADLFMSESVKNPLISRTLPRKATKCKCERI